MLQVPLPPPPAGASRSRRSCFAAWALSEWQTCSKTKASCSSCFAPKRFNFSCASPTAFRATVHCDRSEKASGEGKVCVFLCFCASVCVCVCASVLLCVCVLCLCVWSVLVVVAFCCWLPLVFRSSCLMGLLPPPFAHFSMERTFDPTANRSRLSETLKHICTSLTEQMRDKKLVGENSSEFC